MASCIQSGMKKILIIVALLLSVPSLASAMSVDGRLDEAEWQDARSFNEFRVVEPLTRAQPEQIGRAHV